MKKINFVLAVMLLAGTVSAKESQAVAAKENQAVTDQLKRKYQYVSYRNENGLEYYELRRENTDDEGYG